MNDSFRTNVFVQYHPETIGCACIYLAARQLQVSVRRIVCCSSERKMVFGCLHLCLCGTPASA